MREIKCSVDHIGCWGPNSSETFPEVETTLASAPKYLKYKSGEHIYSALWKVKAIDSSQLEAYLAYLKELSLTKSLDVVDRSKTSCLILLTSESSGEIYDQVIHNHAHILSPVGLKDGLEHWHLLVRDSTQLKRLLSEMSELGEVRISRIGKYEPTDNKFSLTDKQFQALRLALFNGYYEWPRRITLEELASIQGVSRRTFQDHLRKGEAKAIPNMMYDFFNLKP